MSMIGLASKPITAVDPMCSTALASDLRTARSGAMNRAAAAGHAGGVAVSRTVP